MPDNASQEGKNNSKWWQLDRYENCHTLTVASLGRVGQVEKEVGLVLS